MDSKLKQKKPEETMVKDLFVSPTVLLESEMTLSIVTEDTVEEASGKVEYVRRGMDPMSMVVALLAEMRKERQQDKME